ncbi:MAG TPA: 2-amino-4-hydroxy-6-hydroxymethyldihydropteridine diphosphokinase [bacterium]
MDNIFILLGTNEGDLKKNLQTALKHLQEKMITIQKKSRIYMTKPWGNTDQPDFLNMVIEASSERSPAKLLQCLKSIERDMGRRKNAFWGPRVIDLDILFYGRRVVNQKDLIIPHKEFFHRSFALIPMAEIAADFRPPRRIKTIKEYARELGDEGVKVYRN